MFDIEADLGGDGTSPQKATKLPGTPNDSTQVQDKTALLSPLLEKIPAFVRHVIAILQRVIEDNDDAIEFGVGEFLRHSRITNELGLSLLTETDVPDGPEDSIWTSPVFRKAFLTVCMRCGDHTIGPYTDFNTLRKSVYGYKGDEDNKSTLQVSFPLRLFRLWS